MKTGFQIAGMFVFVLGVQLLTPKISNTINTISNETNSTNGNTSNPLNATARAKCVNSPDLIVAKKDDKKKDDTVPKGSTGTGRRV